MINFLKKIKQSINFLLNRLSKLIPKNKKVWVFIGWHRHPQGEIFADNSKYFFLHISNNKKDILPIWLAKSSSVAKKLRENGYKSFYEKSLSGIWYALRAQKTIIDAYIQPENFRWSGGSEIIQLTHGRGMKKEGYNSKQPCVQNLVFSTSDFTKEILPKVFTEGGTVHVTGFPRNDIFFSKIKGAEIDTDEKLIAKLSELKKNNKILLYSPTFRRGEKYADIESRLELGKVSNWLEKRNMYLVLSLHPKYREQKRSVLSNRIIFMEECDIYPILPIFDLFINDYSSIFADQILLERPMVFFPFDLKEYEASEGLMFDYIETMPGPKSFNLEELLKNIDDILSNDNYKEARQKIKEKYHKYNDGNSSERILKIISN